MRLLHFPSPRPEVPRVGGLHDACPSCSGRAWETVEPTLLSCRNCGLHVTLAPDAPALRPLTLDELRRLEADLLAQLAVVQERLAAIAATTRRSS